MPKYRALQLLWSLELEREIQPDEEFEVENDENFPALIEMGAVEPATKARQRKEIQVMEESNAPNN